MFNSFERFLKFLIQKIVPPAPPKPRKGFQDVLSFACEGSCQVLLRVSGLQNSRRCASLIPCFIKFACFYNYLVSFWQSLAACCLVHLTCCVYCNFQHDVWLALRSLALLGFVCICLALLVFVCLCLSWLGFKRQSGFSKRPFGTKIRKRPSQACHRPSFRTL